DKIGLINICRNIFLAFNDEDDDDKEENFDSLFRKQDQFRRCKISRNEQR
ncbi:hypothetical protein LOAG_15934, partial [Loa loa]